jgi:hypothetical protein
MSVFFDYIGITFVSSTGIEHVVNRVVYLCRLALWALSLVRTSLE